MLSGYTVFAGMTFDKGAERLAGRGAVGFDEPRHGVGVALLQRFKDRFMFFE